MARFRRRAGEPRGASREHQLTIFERLDELTRRAEPADAATPAFKVFCVVLALMALGLVLQASHAATVGEPREFTGELREQTLFRLLGLGALLLGYRLGPQGLRHLLPALAVLAAVLLVCVWIPPLASPENGAHRWIRLWPSQRTIQPSELARVVMVMWAADRCVRLGVRVTDARRGLLPLLATGLFFVALIGLETDLGAALVFLACFLSVTWVGGARLVHAAGSLAGVGGVALLLAASSLQYIRGRFAVFMGAAENTQVQQAKAALASGGLWGVGLGQGTARTSGIPYQDSDYVFALVGEELGLVGMIVTIGLLVAFVWFSLRLVLGVRDRYRALAAFGLLLSVGVQAMIHLQVVTGLAPPKGMTLPFLSDGGTSLLVSSLAVGLALGAARPAREERAVGLPRGVSYSRP